MPCCLLRERDTDKDGKVNFKEFFHGLFDMVRNYDEEGHNTSHEFHDSTEGPARTLFSQLDKDGDRYSSNIHSSVDCSVTDAYHQLLLHWAFLSQILVRYRTVTSNRKAPPIGALLCKTTSRLYFITGINLTDY